MKEHIGAGMRLLLVDDDIALRGIAAAHLRKAGFEVEVACNGQEALRLVLRERPSLVVTDIMMPVMDGAELLQALRRRPETRQTYVIFLTARDRTADVLEGFAATADDYLTKPFNMAELVARVMAGARLVDARQRLEEINARLQEEIRQKARLLGVAAHDIRNPVNIVTTYVSLLGQDIISPEEIKEVCLRRLTELVQLVDNLLDVAKIDAGLVELVDERVDGNALLAEVVALFKPVAVQRGVSLDVRAAEGCLARGDERRVQEAMSALLHTVLRLAREKSSIRVSLAPDGRMLCFAVEARGQDLQARITERIFDLPSDSNQMAEGFSAGDVLGLAIVRKGARLMGGEAFAHSADDMVRIGFRLPKAAPEQA